MAQATINLAGAYSLTPPSFPPSSQQQIGSPIGQTNYVQYWQALQFDLTSDAATPIPFPPGMTKCNFLYIAVQGGQPIDLTLTSADGSSQVVPCDPLVIQYFNNRPLSAISLTRSPGVLTTITYLIAQNQ